MIGKASVIALTVGVALVGGYLYRATRGQTTSSESASPAGADSLTPAAAPARRSARPLDAVAPPSAGSAAVVGTIAPTVAPTGAPTVAPPTPPPVGTPGVHLEVRDRFDGAPGLSDPSARARGDLTAPEPALDAAAAEVLAEARAAFRRGDYQAARGAARKLLATAPDSDAARRLAVSASCRLHDAAGARADAEAIPPNQRAAVRQYCATAGVALEAAP